VTRIGRPSDPEGRPLVAIDIGGTHTRIAQPSGPVRFKTEQVYERQLAALTKVLDKPGKVGVSFGGRLDPSGETVSVALNLPAYQGRSLRADLAERFGCPVRVAHDPACGLLGEWTAGSLRGVERCAYLTLSTGVGSALRLGPTLLSTEASHQLVPGNDRLCACGQRGCLETLVGGRALERFLGRPLEHVDDAGFWHGYAEMLAPALANVALIAGVEAIALGGSIVLRRPGLFAAIEAAVARTHTYHPVRLTLAELADEAPLAGAAALFDLPEGAILH
jgi:predicted NBD/HSP70 family sugar kinase